MIEFTEDELKLKEFLQDYATDSELDVICEYLQAQDFDSADVIIEQILKRVE